MRIKLYLKIFLSFIALLLITQALMGILFYFASERSFHREFHSRIYRSILLLRRTVDEHLVLSPGGVRSPRLIEYLRDTGRILESSIWVTDGHDRVVARSFSGAIPSLPLGEIKDAGDHQFIMKAGRGRDLLVYFRLPLKLPHGADGYLHVLHRRDKRPIHDSIIPLGFGAICIIIAALLYPLSRYITGPLKRLTVSALRVSAGDFEQRVPIKSRDEIGELAKAFNTMAERIGAMISSTRELAANISHELRSPLARIRVSLGLLAEKGRAAKNPRTSRIIRSIETEIEEMDGLIGRILTLSKLDSQPPDELEQSYDLIALVDEIAGRFGALMRAKRISFRKEIPDAPFHLTGSPGEMRTAISNCFDNAVKFTPANGRIGLRVIKGNPVTVSIANTCEPLSDDELERMFKPFSRIGKKREPGAGLGLAITSKIIARHGGRIVSQRTGDGIEIRITLPRLYS